MMICWMLSPAPTMKRIVTMMVSLSLSYLSACNNAARNAMPRLRRKPFCLKLAGCSAPRGCWLGEPRQGCGHYHTGGRTGPRGLLGRNGHGRGWTGGRAIRIPGPGDKPPPKRGVPLLGTRRAGCCQGRLRPRRIPRAGASGHHDHPRGHFVLCGIFTPPAPLGSRSPAISAASSPPS